MSYTFNPQSTKEENISKFLEYVYNNHCMCESSCYSIQNVSIATFKKTSNCNQIIESDTEEDYYSSVREITLLFVHYRLLRIVSGRYYLNGISRFTWNNVKKIEDTYTRGLFWIFRKAIVDSVVKSLLKEYTDVIAYSVGSVKLTSDYDISVYGNPGHISALISDFKKAIGLFFKNSSESLFDTNLYGTSFINFSPSAEKSGLYTKHTCQESTFNYLRESPVYQHSQFIFAMVFYYSVLAHVFDSDTIEKIWDSLDATVSEHASTVYYYIQNQGWEYSKLVAAGTLSIPQGVLEKYYLGSELLLQSDYTSICSFFSSEAYLTRGAFMDVVVNAQMCKGSMKVTLGIDALIQSAIENLAFAILHGNKKYTERAVLSLETAGYCDLASKLYGLYKESIDNYEIGIIKKSNDNVIVIKVIQGIVKRYIVNLKESSVPLYDMAIAEVQISRSTVGSRKISREKFPSESSLVG